MNAPDPLSIAGLLYGLPAAEYHAHESMSASGAKKMLRSPQHYKLMRDTPSAPTPAMEFGTATHAAVLEPATYESVIAIAPDVNKRSKDGKAEHAAFAEANAGKVILTQADADRVLRCRDAVLAHPAASELLLSAEVELSLFWQDVRFGVPCKARWDARSNGGIIDLKTCQDASPEAFGRQAASLLYHVQAAHYWSAGEHVIGKEPEFFAFVCVESEPPHAVACYTMPSNAIAAGGHLMQIALERYAAALSAGKWPGYPDTVESLRFPAWALKFDV